MNRQHMSGHSSSSNSISSDNAFEVHETSYKRASMAMNARINGFISGNLSAMNPSTREYTIELFKAAESSVRGMELEANALEGEEQKLAVLRAKQYRHDLEDLTKTNKEMELQNRLRNGKPKPEAAAAVSYSHVSTSSSKS